MHHTSSISAGIGENVRFYTGVLGMRFVYRSVNQDDVSMYHLAYGNEGATLGSVATFFDIPGAAPNRAGRDEVANISFRVRGEDTLGWWAARFDELGVEHGEVGVRYDGRPKLDFQDGEGHRMSLVDDGGEGMETAGAWDGSEVPTRHGIVGLESTRLVVKGVAATAVALEDLLGLRRVAEYESGEASGSRIVVFESGGGGPGTEVHVEERPELERSRQGAGGVHHIAFRAKDEAEIERWADRVSGAGLPNSGVVDRHYFKSVYFREPNGVLFEIATDEPGWAMDGEDTLGRELVLPPFLEDRRAEIEANLKPIPVPDFSVEHKG